MSGRFRALALDVGLTTGYAVASYDDVFEHGTIHADCLRPALLTLVREYGPISDVVVEGTIPGRSRLQRQLQALEQTVRQLFPDAVWIIASQWKTTSARHAPVPSRCKTKHERDALRILHWYMHGPYYERRNAQLRLDLRGIA